MNKKSDILFIVPYFIGFALFWIIPFFVSLGYAFIDNNLSARFVGLRNFLKLLENQFFRLAMKNTILFSLIAVILMMVLSVGIALWIARHAARLSVLRSVFFLPVVLPSITIVMFWNAYLAEVPPFPSLILMYLWKYLGLHITLVLTGITMVDPMILDASRIDGAGSCKQDLYIILPSITPTLFFSLVLSLVNAMKIFRESYLMWGSYPDESVYMMQNYLDNHFAKLNYPNISTAAIFFAISIYTVIGVIYWLEHRWEREIW